MIDLHCHLIYGVDDGSPDFAASEIMLDEAAGDGVRIIYCTSHASVSGAAPQIPPDLIAAAARRGIELRPGAEYPFRVLLTPEERPLQTLGNSAFLLLEFDRAELPERLPDILFEATRSGKLLIAAHPERSFFSLEPFKRLAECGVFFQLTAGSLLGEYGRSAQRLAEKAIESGYCHYIASDAHGGTRGFRMAECRRRVTEKFGADAAELFFERNPEALDSNGEPESRPFRKAGWRKNLRHWREGWLHL